MTSLTRTAHGPASGLRQGRSRACDAYQRRIAVACTFTMTTESSHSLERQGQAVVQAPPASRLPRWAFRLYDRFMGQKLVSPATYWRRRVVVLAIGVTILGLPIWAVNQALGGSHPPGQ